MEQASNETIAIGDQVTLVERSFTNDGQTITAKVIDIRSVLDKETYVVEISNGSRKVVGRKQITKVA